MTLPTIIQEAIRELPEAEQRAAVVAYARRWIGTPYHHAADKLDHGVDCGMILVRVFVDTGLCAPFDPRPYSRQWYMHRDEEVYLGYLQARAIETEDPKPGDLVMWKVGRTFSHGAIVTEWPKVIHAAAREKLVLEQPIENCYLAGRPRKFYSYWERGQ